MSGDMNVKKNQYLEEWNGRREITEKTFEYNRDTTPALIGTYASVIYYHSMKAF